MKLVTITLGALLVAQAAASAQKTTAALPGSDASEEHTKKSARYAATAVYDSLKHAAPVSVAVYGQQRFLEKHTQAHDTLLATGTQDIFHELHPEFDSISVNGDGDGEDGLWEGKFMADRIALVARMKKKELLQQQRDESRKLQSQSPEQVIMKRMRAHKSTKVPTVSPTTATATAAPVTSAPVVTITAALASQSKSSKSSKTSLEPTIAPTTLLGGKVVVRFVTTVTFSGIDFLTLGPAAWSSLAALLETLIGKHVPKPTGSGSGSGVVARRIDDVGDRIDFDIFLSALCAPESACPTTKDTLLDSAAPIITNITGYVANGNFTSDINASLATNPIPGVGGTRRLHTQSRTLEAIQATNSTTSAPEAQVTLRSAKPSSEPSSEPSDKPSIVPSTSNAPSSDPSLSPSGNPSSAPSSIPSTDPSLSPSDNPSVSLVPSLSPSDIPSVSSAPSSIPSDNPSVSSVPSLSPSDIPSVSSVPSSSSQPSSEPSSSSQPSQAPTDVCAPLPDVDGIYIREDGKIVSKGTDPPECNEIGDWDPSNDEGKGIKIDYDSEVSTVTNAALYVGYNNKKQVVVRGQTFNTSALDGLGPYSSSAWVISPSQNMTVCDSLFHGTYNGFSNNGRLLNVVNSTLKAPFPNYGLWVVTGKTVIVGSNTEISGMIVSASVDIYEGTFGNVSDAKEASLYVSAGVANVYGGDFKSELQAFGGTINVYKKPDAFVGDYFETLCDGSLFDTRLRNGNLVYRDCPTDYQDQVPTFDECE